VKACLICDDHALVREALAGTVRLDWQDARITTANDFPAAWAAAPGHDGCIADLMMPGAEPLDGIAGLRRAAPDMAILVVTGTEDDGLLLGLLNLGIAGFAPNTASGAIIEAALKLIDVGGRYLPPRLLARPVVRDNQEPSGDHSGRPGREKSYRCGGAGAGAGPALSLTLNVSAGVTLERTSCKRAGRRIASKDHRCSRD
jgi:DNA-binding NarL/FixJ family response regulator